MGENSVVRRVRIVVGEPWKDALISVLEPRSPYRPWRTANGVEPGDAVIAVIETDPLSVLAAVATVGPGDSARSAFADIDRLYLNGLLELGSLNMLADFVVQPQLTTVYHRRSVEGVVALIGEYNPSTVDALFGYTSLAAGRVLLNSGGKCSGCELQLDLTGEDARDHVHIHTAPRPSLDTKRARQRRARQVAKREPGGSRRRKNNDGYSAISIESGRRYPISTSSDWPAVLCDSCDERMLRSGFISFLDFKFALHPRCPSCSAQRSSSTLYGMPIGPVDEPWISAMGCCVQPWEWLCTECGHTW